MEQVSKTPLIIGIAVVAVILIVVGWVSLQNQPAENPPVAATLPTPTPTPSQMPSEEDVAISADTSDASLDQDLAAIDNQLNGLDKDSSTIAEGINAPTEAEQ